MFSSENLRNAKSSGDQNGNTIKSAHSLIELIKKYRIKTTCHSYGALCFSVMFVNLCIILYIIYLCIIIHVVWLFMYHNAHWLIRARMWVPKNFMMRIKICHPLVCIYVYVFCSECIRVESLPSPCVCWWNYVCIRNKHIIYFYISLYLYLGVFMKA